MRGPRKKEKRKVSAFHFCVLYLMPHHKGLCIKKSRFSPFWHFLNQRSCAIRMRFVHTMRKGNERGGTTLLLPMIHKPKRANHRRYDAGNRLPRFAKRRHLPNGTAFIRGIFAKGGKAATNAGTAHRSAPGWPVLFAGGDDPHPLATGFYWRGGHPQISAFAC